MDDITAIRWLDRAKDFATLIVAVGVAGEFLFDRIERPISRRIDEAREERIATVNERALKLGVELEKERQKTSQLQSDIMKLHVRTEYRHLTPEQRESIKDKMKEFSGINFALILYQSENDAMGLSSDIQNTLSGPDGAGWNLGSSGGIGSGAPETGVVIKFKPDATATIKTAADKLAEALRRANLYAPKPTRISDDNLDVNLRMMIGRETQIVIVIGKRP